MRILVVDDDQSFATMLKEALEAKGHTVTCRFDPVAGAAALQAVQPELLFLDVDMPAGGGAGVYSGLRGNPAMGNLPVIVVTGTTPQNLVWQKLKASPHPRTHLFAKPVDLAELMKWVDGFASQKP